MNQDSADLSDHSTEGAPAPAWTDRFFQPVDIAALAAFRIIFGGCMLFENAKYWSLGYLRSYLIAPDFHFSFYTP